MNARKGTALTGIGCVVAAGICFAILDTITKGVVMVVPILMALWVRYLIQATFTTLALAPRHGALLWRSRSPGLQLVRGALLVLTTMLAYLSLRYIPVGEFTAIVMVTPLAVTVLSVLIFKERVVPLQWLFVIGGFAGTLVIVRPGGENFGWAVLFPLGTMAGNSAFQLLTGRLARVDNAATTHFFSGWTGALLVSLALPLIWSTVDSPWLWLMMVTMGLLAATGHFLLAQAYQHAPASTLMPYLYCQLGFAVLAGWLVFSHLPDGWTLAGIALIAACGVGSAWFTARRSPLPPA
ncbi:MAG: DMT family transporter [Burkholderiaceae bacterium]